jgi:hypothetical protein
MVYLFNRISYLKGVFTTPNPSDAHLLMSDENPMTGADIFIAVQMSQP